LRRKNRKRSNGVARTCALDSLRALVAGARRVFRQQRGLKTMAISNSNAAMIAVEPMNSVHTDSSLRNAHSERIHRGGLIINVRAFLVGARNPAPEWFLSLLVFHELMHTYTRPVNTTSTLRKKHPSESAVTLNHLHVLALEKFVLTKMGKVEELKWLDQQYRTASPPAYKRAWEIVNDVEGVDRLLNELKVAAR
jgi:hypothetical protein